MKNVHSVGPAIVLLSLLLDGLGIKRRIIDVALRKRKSAGKNKIIVLTPDYYVCEETK